MAKEEQPSKDNEKPETKAESNTANSSSNTPKYLAAGALSLLVLAMVFCAGMAAQQRRSRELRVQSFGFGGPSMMVHGGEHHFGGGFIDDQQNSIILTGKIATVNGNDFTIDQNGSNKTVKTDSNTHFAGVGIAGLKSGDTVTVAGTTNSDGSIQALSVAVTTSIPN